MQKLGAWTRILAIGLLFAASAGSALADYTSLLSRAKAGDQGAQLDLGNALMFGFDGAKESPREAIRWLTAARKGGGDLGRRATVNLGLLYGNRSFGQPDGAKAVKLLEEVARWPDMAGKSARSGLASLYHMSPRDATIPTNFDKALFWYFAAQASAAPEGKFGLNAQINRSIREIMTQSPESSESAVEIQGRAVEWVRRVEGRH